MLLSKGERFPSDALPMIVADISFECPHCDGPLITEAAHSGMKTDCPHCFRELEVPEGTPINKNKFIEPLGLRRTLNELRDREWEIHRRKLREALKRNGELEEALATAPRQAVPADEQVLEECEALRTELAAAWEELAAARQQLAESREQHGITLHTLRAERDAFREEMGSLQAAREKADAEAAGLRKNLTALGERLKEESAKVFIMEAAIHNDMSQAAPHPVDFLDLKEEVADLRKRNYALQQSRDGAKEELARLRQASADVSEDRLNHSLTSRASGMSESMLSLQRGI